MKFSESWLRSFVDPAVSGGDFTHLLTMAGLEVEEEETVAPASDGVVVAEVLEVAIVENIQRADLNATEEAASYRQLMDRFGHTQEKLG